MMRAIKVCAGGNGAGGADGPPRSGLCIDSPHSESGPEPLFRVVYVIDVNAADPIDAARQVHEIMADPDSLPPLLEVIDDVGRVVSVDLSLDWPA